MVECAWYRTRKQLEFVQRIELDEEYQRIMGDLVRTLVMRLSSAISLINQTLKQESDRRPGLLGFAQKVRRPKYMLLKTAIDDAVREVEAWQTRFDPSWFLIMRTAGPVIGAELKHARESEGQNAVVARSAASSLGRYSNSRPTQTPIQAAWALREVLAPEARHVSVFLPSVEFERRSIPYSSAQIARPCNQRDARWFIVDSVLCRPGQDPNDTARHVRLLAQKLNKVDPLAFGLLGCKGVIRVSGDPATGRCPSLDMVLRAPEGFDSGISLRQFLLDGQDQGAFVSLSRSMAIAKELARAVCSVHTFKFVHKNVRPESVLLLNNAQNANANASTSATFLVGFDNFRSADGATNLRGDAEWDRNMYRHPSRQGEFPEEKYRMHHDIYSLGICLLELGLRESFISYDAAEVPQPGPRFNNFNAWLESEGRGGSWGVSIYLKDYFEYLARTQLPSLIGDRYTRIVISCLTCLDEGSDDFGEEVDASDRDGIALGMKFIQNILLQINEITI